MSSSGSLKTAKEDETDQHPVGSNAGDHTGADLGCGRGYGL